MARLTRRRIRRARRDAAKNPQSMKPAAPLTLSEQIRQASDMQERWSNVRLGHDFWYRIADEVDDALFDERADGWDEGHRASCVYSPDCDLNDHHPNPYRTPKEC